MSAGRAIIVCAYTALLVAVACAGLPLADWPAAVVGIVAGTVIGVRLARQARRGEIDEGDTEG